MKRRYVSLLAAGIAGFGLVLWAAPGENATKQPVAELEAEQAARALVRQYRAAIDGTTPPSEWPGKMRKPDKWTWVADMDTSKLPGGYPEQIIVTVGAAGGHTGKPKQ